MSALPASCRACRQAAWACETRITSRDPAEKHSQGCDVTTARLAFESFRHDRLWTDFTSSASLVRSPCGLPGGGYMPQNQIQDVHRPSWADPTPHWIGAI